MIMRSAKVPLSPSSALQTMYFCGAWVCATVRHLMPVGKPAPPRPRRPDCDDLLDDRLRPERERALKPLAAAMRAVIVKRARIDDAATREGEPRLPLEPGDFLGQPGRKRMPTVGEERVRAGFGVARRDRPIATRPAGVSDLDHRLEPVEPARAGADDLDRDVPPRGRGAQCGRHLIGADRQRRRHRRGMNSRSVIAASPPARHRGGWRRAVR